MGSSTKHHVRFLFGTFATFAILLSAQSALLLGGVPLPTPPPAAAATAAASDASGGGPDVIRSTWDTLVLYASATEHLEAGRTDRAAALVEEARRRRLVIGPERPEDLTEGGAYGNMAPVSVMLRFGQAVGRLAGRLSRAGRGAEALDWTRTVREAATHALEAAPSGYLGLSAARYLDQVADRCEVAALEVLPGGEGRARARTARRRHAERAARLLAWRARLRAARKLEKQWCDIEGIPGKPEGGQAAAAFRKTYLELTGRELTGRREASSTEVVNAGPLGPATAPEG